MKYDTQIHILYNLIQYYTPTSANTIGVTLLLAILDGSRTNRHGWVCANRNVWSCHIMSIIQELLGLLGKGLGSCLTLAPPVPSPSLCSHPNHRYGCYTGTFNMASPKVQRRFPFPGTSGVTASQAGRNHSWHSNPATNIFMGYWESIFSGGNYIWGVLFTDRRFPKWIRNSSGRFLGHVGNPPHESNWQHPVSGPHALWESMGVEGRESANQPTPTKRKTLHGYPMVPSPIWGNIWIHWSSIHVYTHHGRGPFFLGRLWAHVGTCGHMWALFIRTWQANSANSSVRIRQ